MERLPCVYLLASKRNGTLYTGVTSNLVKRGWKINVIEAMNPQWKDLYSDLL